ncbi:NACHT domain-containing protein [Neisseria zalophi]|uniref:NACHT domain-containing protein n=1 Tax=Neisseria zalophi TaxID=640030 RepID=A0A5J6PWH6_9NEIS|nr:NACHT domain-containing protein [Neisseria zalophi]QEY26614.1 NACHT domain-containing protein [Neisseria zalophi]
MPINWGEIKPFQNSQNNAFEELVCQLAREEFGQSGHFTRIAAPDGGVEAICELEDGNLYGWQAKYFINSFTSSQWRQIQDSFEEALENYPNLIRYYICVPIDRNNASVQGRKSFLTKWHEHIQQWQQIAESRGRSIEFIFWGNSELTDLLSKPQNAGKRYFWFQEQELSDQWFEQYNNQAIANLGARYTPEINIDLPIALKFEALARSQSFKKQYTHRFHQLLIDIQKHFSSFQALAKEIQDEDKLLSILGEVIESCKQSLNLTKYTDEIIPIDLLLAKIKSAIKQINLNIKYDNDDKSQEDINSFLKDIRTNFFYLKNILESDEIQLFNGEVLWLRGEAGVGKSHLMGDMISQRMQDSQYSILLLGQDFTENSNIWNQILSKQLNLPNLSPKDFLTALDSIAQAQKERFILAIDALNEGAGKNLWPNQLNGFIQLIQEYPRIGLVLSVRSTYEKIINKNLSKSIQKVLCIIDHEGFAGHEFDAIPVFFEYYGLNQPTIPLLNSEFSNPLYLKLFCESLNKQGYTSVPKGYQGITQIIDSYINGIEKKIAYRLEEDESLQLVKRAINIIIELDLSGADLNYLSVKKEIAKTLQDYIAEADAKKFIDYLIQEGVLNKNIPYSHEQEYIYFTYERIGEYQKALYFLQKINSLNDLIQWFQTTKGQEILNQFNLYKGLWEAFSVLLPERLNIELFEVISFENNNYELLNIIIHNLLWRIPKHIDLQKINKFLNDNHQYFDPYLWPYSWIEMLYQLAAEPNHPLNSMYLHENLFNLSMADRDAQWTTCISHEFDNNSPISRLLNWCKNYSHQPNLTEESLLLIAIAISWLLTSTNIKQRNQAIQALADLLWNRLNIAYQLLQKFEAVNDPYVLEGILSATYGAILYSDNLNSLKKLADEVYTQIFNISKNQEVLPNVLIRDYARHIIDYSLSKNQNSYSSEEKYSIQEHITPPYNSSFPTTLPSTEEIDNKYSSDEEQRIIRSMTTEYGRGVNRYGDFGRYTFEHSFSLWRGNPSIHTDLLSNYACHLIFEDFGYDCTKHANFDKSLRNITGEQNKIKRIGKKYQWLALYETLARVMDNFQIYDDKGNELRWVTDLNQFYLPKANIQPIPILQKQFDEQTQQVPLQDIKGYYGEEIPDWWDGEAQDWVINSEALPNIPAIIETQIDDEDWVFLEKYDYLNHPEKFAEYDTQRKTLWFQIRSYLIPKRDLNRAKKWLETQNFMGRWMPEGKKYDNNNLQEFFKISPPQSVDKINWQTINHNRDINVLPTVDQHYQRSTYENNGYTIYAPCYFLYQSMNMNLSNKQGYFVDQQNDLVCFNPLISNKPKAMLLIKKAPFIKFLKENDLAVFWTCLGEKLIHKSEWDFHNKRLDFSGLYYFDRSQRESIKGQIKTESFEPKK